MQEIAPFVFVLGLALISGTALVLRGPIGKALADWIRGWSRTDADWMMLQAKKHGVDLGSDQVQGDLEELRRRLADVEERLDFTERLLAQERQGARLAPPGGAR